MKTVYHRKVIIYLIINKSKTLSENGTSNKYELFFISTLLAFINPVFKLNPVFDMAQHLVCPIHMAARSCYKSCDG
jgi:hypothetical protein